MKKPVCLTFLFFLLMALCAGEVAASVPKTDASMSAWFPFFKAETKSPLVPAIVFGRDNSGERRWFVKPSGKKVKGHLGRSGSVVRKRSGYRGPGQAKIRSHRKKPVFSKQIILAANAPRVTSDASPLTMPDQEPLWNAVAPGVPNEADIFLKSAAEGSREKTSRREIAAAAQAPLLSPVSDISASGTNKTGDLPVRIEANNLSYDNVRDVYEAEGNVVITYDEGVLTAARVEYDRRNNLAIAQGGAFLKMAEDSLAGEKIVVDVENKTGVAYQAKAYYARNHFYIRGDKIEKTGEASYRIENPLATTCDGDHPDWQLAGSEMKVTIDGYGWVSHARMLTKGLPVLYAPIVAFPAKTRRQTGFIFPYLAYSRGKDGLDIELPFFWAMNPQMDATLYARYLEKRGVKAGAEFRYFVGSKSFGTLYGDYLEDNKHVTENIGNLISRDWQEMHRRWSFMINHQTNFDSQFYVRTDLKRVSDAWYFRDFNGHNYYLTHYAGTEEDPFKKVPFLANESLRSLESSARIFKGWDHFNVMARVSATDDFAAANNDRTLQKYPEVIFTGIKQPLFKTPVYVEMTGNYDYFYRGEGTRGHYVDVAPTISLPIGISKYVKITPQLTVREIYWNREDRVSDSTDPSGDRTVINAALGLSSRLSRVFQVGLFNWDRIRHEIKPELLYSFMPNIRPQSMPDYIPRIGSLMDPFAPMETGGSAVLAQQNAVAWSLTNTLTARLKNKSEANGYLEIFRFKLFQVYDIREAAKDMAGSALERRPLSDLGIELDVRPHPYVGFAARNKYNPYTGWKEMNYDLGLSDRRGDRLAFGYRYTLDSIEEVNMDFKAVITERLSGRLVVRLDRFNSQTVENTVGLTYTKQCWGVGVDYTKTHDDERFLLKISLAGLGMFGF